MAEVSGLVLGAVALASLFNTCVDCFECVQLGRSYVEDYQLACTKICLLKARLSAWGMSLNVEVPGSEHPALRRYWTEEKDVVGRSLFGIKEIFDDTSRLTEKYKLTTKHSRTFRSTVAHRLSNVPPASEELKSLKLTVTGWSLLRKRTTWAIHDKQKFDSLIEDLRFLIENLEEVTYRIGMSHVKEPVDLGLAHRQPSNQHQSPLSRKIKVIAQRPVQAERSASEQLAQRANHSGAASNVKELAEDASARGTLGNVYNGNQLISANIGVMGNVGGSNKRHTYFGDQTVNGDGCGIMGDISEKAWEDRRQPDYERRKLSVANDRGEEIRAEVERRR